MMKTRSGILVFMLLISVKVLAEGSKELNTGCSNFSTNLYLCNDFTGQCSTTGGIRTQFATYSSTQSCDTSERLYFATLAGEIVYMGFKGAPPTNRYIVYRIKDASGNIVYPETNLPTSGTGYIANLTQACNGPNILLPPPSNTGYDAISWTPENGGTFFIEFSLKNSSNNNYVYTQFSIDLFDITIYNPATLLVKPGRLYSKSWQFSETNNFSGINYILSDDGIVTSAQFNDMNGGAWVQYANQTGCGTTNWMVDRNSLWNQQALFPQYKIFLNSPDPAIFPIATTLGQIIPPDPSGTRYCDGHIDFLVNVDKAGNVEIDLNFVPSTYITRVLNQAVTAGINTITWDGKDDNGIDVPNNVQITFTVKYINGLTNLPLYDVEGNSSGFLVQLIEPAGAAPHIFWNDSIIWAHPAGNTNQPGGGPNNMDVKSNVSTGGCLSPATFPGCHKWNQTQHTPPGDWGNLNTINSWWYTVSTSTTYPPIYEYRSPQLLVFQTPPQDLCAGASGINFSVNSDPNTDQYNWGYTGTGATFIPSAITTTNSVTVNFAPNATSGNITVFGTNSNCNSSPSPIVNLAVNIHPNPLPTISGNAAVCIQSAGNVYTTETGMTNYIWAVTGGTITAGGTTTDNTVTVTWNTTGVQTVSVSYTNSFGCTSASPTIKNVTVNPLPVPTFTSGDNTVCIGTPGHIYTTEGGKSGYIWNVTGGTITAGGTNSDNTATVTWNATGLQSISVNYTDGNGCTAPSPTVFNVTVNPLPVPSFTSGDAAACAGTSGHIYTTQAGMANYIWSLTGGSITAGGGSHDNTVTVTWTSPGSQTISINYNDPNGCIAVNPAIMTVTVNALPVPVISGPATVCLNHSCTYTVQAGMTGYTWTVTGGIITGGGSATDHTATVLWNTLGLQSISVNYTDGNGCTATSPTVYNVQVNILPVPTITGSASVCAGSSASYTTETGMSNYTWSVSAGGTIVAGAGTPAITVQWNTAGAQTVNVNYVVGTGCTAASPTVKNITVNPLPAPIITGPATPCGQTLCTYTVGAPQANYAYIWTVTGGTPVSGTSSSIDVTWGNTNPVTIGMQESITYPPGVVCTSTAPAFPVTLALIPDAAGAISGPSAVCQTLTKTYTVAPINNSDSYTWWYVPATGVTITNNGTSANLTFDLTSASGNLYVKGNKTGCASGPASPAYPVTVYTPPYVSLTACNDITTTSSSRPFNLKGGVPPGGKYYIDGNLVSSGIFDPGTLSTTTHQVTYSFTDHNTCVSISSSVAITVVPGSVLTNCPATFTDPRDNKTYRAASMGTRCWMLDNLTYGNVLIPVTQEQRDNCTPEKYCFTADPACATYGGLYQWDELMQYDVPASGQYLQGLCPPEWHVPTQTEWQLLIDGQTNAGNGLAGADLKDPVPAFGFRAFLEGIYYQNNYWAFTSGNSLTATMFWTSTNSGTTQAVARGVNVYNPSVSRYVSVRSNAFPVRCVKD
jgi:uncharacterized protein (TIGR02145 family)